VAVVAKEAVMVLKWQQLPCNIVAAGAVQNGSACKKNQPEVAVVAKVAAAVVAWCNTAVQHCCSRLQCKRQQQ